ncbi:hypothetical protein NAC44_15480 [Allorhizobium sp. BGMRC 0089]|uniref:O-linked N-acetylglucosamine transferase, SPINDLY family protein n=1 Tax=Allorhizobium sonneratiae TaxID=2934936 RepID=UPI0020343067|nr:hypothetical protein [Allorhizobium sonneratiae]MCM2293730.1 hypothetical protein [Allorhizobium sonneratiae]
MQDTERLARAMQLYKGGETDACLSLLQPVMDSGERPFPAVLLAAQCHARLEQNLEAARLYVEAAGQAAGNRELLYLLAARLYLMEEKDEEALPLAFKAVRDDQFDPETHNTVRRLLRSRLLIAKAEASNTAVLKGMESRDPAFFKVDDPYDHLLWCGDEAINHRQTRMSKGEAFTPASKQARRSLPLPGNDRIRIGYLSADFCDQHPTMRLFRGVLASHDRERFDIHHLCITPQSMIAHDRGFRADLANLHCLPKDDEAAKEMVRSLDLDILVDLKGHTKDCRINLVNSGLARLQVAYLGFPGSAFGIDCDYVIGDSIVTPDSARPYYHEKFCRLPDSYQANDNLFRPLPPPATRKDLGLPEEAFVLASFNVVRKISPQTARLWARLMAAIPNALLWILCPPATRQNFLDHMVSLGVSASAIHFADFYGYESHLARLQCADLGLDTYPYNGHTTTSDKLWAGLPVLTHKGSNFASRVSESLLHALGLDELVMQTPDDLVAYTARLAQDRDTLVTLRRKLGENRFLKPLFDTERFTRHLESAFTLMVERDRSGLEPDHFDVPPLPPRCHPFSCPLVGHHPR